MKKIVFTGGGTAGHIYPNLAIAEELVDYEKHYIGTDAMEKDILKKYDHIIFHEIKAVKFNRGNIIKNFLLPIKLLFSIKQAKKILREIKPDVIFSKGGYVSLPVAIASKKLNIPLITHESDLTLGLANKIISKYATVVCTTFYETSKLNKKYLWTGQPLRKSIYEGNKIKVLKKIKFPNKPIILFVGGSLGAKKINDLLDDPTYLTQNYVIIHSVGKNNYPNIQAQENYYPFAYLDPISNFYSAADLVVTRAGSGVINELLALKKPMLMLPLSKDASRGDQIDNAKLFTKLGYGEMILDENLTKEKLKESIDKMLTNINKYKKNLEKADKNEATKKIIELIKKFS